MDIKDFLQSKYDKTKYIQFISHHFSDFAESTSDYIEASQNEQNNIKEYKLLGTCEIEESKEIGFFEFIANEDKEIENNKVSFNSLLKTKADGVNLDGAIAIFTNPAKPNIWRLSFIRFSYDENHKQQISNLKRYTYVVGKDIPINTAYEQLSSLNCSSLDDIQIAFSVEKISKKFFQDYKDLYSYICSYLEPSKAFFTKTSITLFTKKLLGRIVFLYFLEKKAWLGSDENWENGDKKFLSNNFKNQDYTNFYTDILKPIFFQALNTKREKDYFKKLKCQMPFLNGGLFSQEDIDKEELFIGDEVFKKIFDIFDSYNFTIIEDSPNDSEVAIDPEMLGMVFEDLLEDRKDKGAFYTPREIVHYMCQQSIIKYLANDFDDKDAILELVLNQKTDNTYIIKNAKAIQKKLINIKVLDPAIGSGAFPMGMLHEIVLILSSLDKTVDIGVLKREIIENCIYGVDIELSAVEIAKLRFWLSIVVDEDTPTPLPNLDYKIMVGNSLIETINGFDPFEIKNDALFDDNSKSELLNKLIHNHFKESNQKKKNEITKEIDNTIDGIFKEKIKAFQNSIDKMSGDLPNKNSTDKKTFSKRIQNEMKDLSHFQEVIKEKPTTKLFFYKLYFYEAINSGGFDIVIGNPPYLRVQGIDNELSQQYKKFFSSATGNYDLYVLFVEKGLELLSKNGILNYIMPHKWINSSFGKGLRILTKDKISKFISFGAYQVFNASTYTSLMWLENNNKNQVLDYAELDKDLNKNNELEEYLITLSKDNYTNIKNTDLLEDSWVFTNKETYKILDKLKQCPLKLKDIFEKVFQGIATSKDSVYFLKNCRCKDNLVTAFSDELQKEITIEKELLKPLLKGDDVHRYEKLITDKMVIFPYYISIEDDKEKAVLYKENEIEKAFPKGYKYLKECENVLRNREQGKFNINGEWFQYGRKQGILSAHKEKIITPYLSLGSQLSYDENGKFYGNTKCFGLIKKQTIKESYKFYLAILNSKLTWFYISNTSSVMSGGYYTYTKDSLSLFPIPKIDDINDTKPFEILVDYIIYLKSTDKNIDKNTSNAKIIKSYFEKIIDALVYELYFADEFKNKNIEFLKYAKKYFKPIDTLTNDKKIKIIHNAYQSLIKKDNEIKNNLELMNIKLKDLISPIVSSI